MKIGHTTPFTPLDQSVSLSKTKSASSRFEQVFNESLQRQTGAKRDPSPVVQTTATMPCSLNAIDSVDPVSGAQAMEDFIDALEGYQQQLGDPSNCLRDIAPSVERLEQAQRHLADFAFEEPADSPLGPIMNEGLVTAAMEIQRFRSGVYC